MTPTDLLKLCDDLLELSGRATKGPWHACSANREDTGCCPCRLVMDDEAVAVAQAALPSQDDPSKTFNDTPVDERKQAAVNMDLIATSRTALPILASALKNLVPYVEHKGDCNQWAPELSPMPFAIARVASRRCTCGLSSALSEIEGKVSGG